MKCFKKGSVVWACLDGQNSEQRGKRPCIVVQNNVGNKFSKTTIVVPLTSSRTKTNLPVHVVIERDNFPNTKLKDSVALCEQVRVIDKTRICWVEDCVLPEGKMEEIEKALLISFGCYETEEKDLKLVWVKLDGIGCEQRSDKPLPAVVLQNRKGNEFSTTVIVAPMAKKKPKLLPTQVLIPGNQVNESFDDSILMLEQIRVIDKSRIISTNYNADLDSISKSIEDALLISLGIEAR